MADHQRSDSVLSYPAIEGDLDPKYFIMGENMGGKAFTKIMATVLYISIYTHIHSFYQLQ